MGIKRVEWCLHNDCPGGFSEVNIRYLVSNTMKRKVIVVDGDQFIKTYIYNRFQWIYGGIQEYIQEIRKFVDKFKEIGVTLVFFFDMKTTESSMREMWIQRRKRNIEFSKEVINALSRGAKPPERDFGMRPLNVKCMTIYFLSKVMRCEVHCSVTSVKCSVIYATEHNSLAILSQNSHYIFYPNMPAYLSIKFLKIEEMKTRQYNIDAFHEHVQLEQKLFPLVATIVGDNAMKNTKHSLEVARENIRKIVYEKTNESQKTCLFVCVAKLIRNYFVRHNLEDVAMFLSDKFGADGEEIIASYDGFKEMFSLEKLRPSHPNTSWQIIVEQARRLCSSGGMCSKIYKVLRDNLYEHETILENFEEFEGSSVIYGSLRQQLYGILLYEAPENSRQSITEWCVSDDATTDLIVIVPATINLHPGLLSLWDTTNLSHDLQNKRWKMFVDAFAPTHNLDYNLFCNLPGNLVVPVAVLFYLQHEATKTSLPERLLEPWEVEVFIAVGILLSKRERDICKIKISPHTTNVRAVELSALYMCGCHSVNLLVEACGLQAEIDSHILHYFDGKLFHSLYEKAKWNSGTKFLESEVMFQKIKEILVKLLLSN